MAGGFNHQPPAAHTGGPATFPGGCHRAHPSSCRWASSETMQLGCLLQQRLHPGQRFRLQLWHLPGVQPGACVCVQAAGWLCCMMHAACMPGWPCPQAARQRCPPTHPPAAPPRAGPECRAPTQQPTLPGRQGRTRPPAPAAAGRRTGRRLGRRRGRTASGTCQSAAGRPPGCPASGRHSLARWGGGVDQQVRPRTLPLAHGATASVTHAPAPPPPPLRD